MDQWFGRFQLHMFMFNLIIFTAFSSVLCIYTVLCLFCIFSAIFLIITVTNATTCFCSCQVSLKHKKSFILWESLKSDQKYLCINVKYRFSDLSMSLLHRSHLWYHFNNKCINIESFLENSLKYIDIESILDHQKFSSGFSTSNLPFTGPWA